MKDNLNVITIELDIVWENPSLNLLILEEKFNQLSNCNLIVLPEMFNTGFTQNVLLAETMNGNTIQFLKFWANQLNCAISGSLLINEDKSYFNRLVFVYPNGAIDFYDKNHLFTFANEQKNISSGKNQKIIDYLGWKINLLICYDLRFPVWCRNKLNKHYDVTLVVANWPSSRDFAWESLLIARAIENQSYYIGVNRKGVDGNKLNYSGNSIVLNALGEKQPKNDSFYTLNYTELTIIREQFPFLKDQNNFNIND